MEPRTLTHLDRCDACQAQAHVRFVITDDDEWLFCNHHTLKHGPRILAEHPDVFVDDQSGEQ